MSGMNGGNAHSRLHLKKRFLSRARAVDYRLELPVDETILPRLCEALEAGPFQSYLRAGIIDDVKGRDAQPSLVPSLPHLQEGVLFEAAGSAPDETGVDVPFTVRTRSKFLEFAGEQHIRHTVIEEQAGGALPEEVTVRVIGRAFPMKLSHVRFGLEVFHGKSTIMGASPMVTAFLAVEASDRSLVCEIRNEDCRDPLVPIEPHLFSSLSSLFEEVVSFSLRDDYLAQVKGSH